MLPLDHIGGSMKPVGRWVGPYSHGLSRRRQNYDEVAVRKTKLHLAVVISRQFCEFAQAVSDHGSIHDPHGE